MTRACGPVPDKRPRAVKNGSARATAPGCNERRNVIPAHSTCAGATVVRTRANAGTSGTGAKATDAGKVAPAPSHRKAAISPGPEPPRSTMGRPLGPAPAPAATLRVAARVRSARRSRRPVSWRPTGVSIPAVTTATAPVTRSTVNWTPSTVMENVLGAATGGAAAPKTSARAAASTGALADELTSRSRAAGSTSRRRMASTANAKPPPVTGWVRPRPASSPETWATAGRRPARPTGPRPAGR